MPPLVQGLTLKPTTPPDSRPQEQPIPIEDVPLLFPRGGATGRLAPDGTNWCRCCDMTISTHAKAAFCDVHRRERNTAQQRAGRAQDRPAVAGVQVETIDVIVSRTDLLQAALGRATQEFNRMPKPPVGSWIDDLMLVAKDLTHAVDHGLRPLSSLRRVPERERRATARPEA
jgi:hypothetical protein